MEGWLWLYFGGLWAFCGYLGWRHVLHKSGGIQTTWDAFMIGPCMAAGPVVLYKALKEFSLTA